MTEAKEDLRQFAERFWKEQYGELTSRYDIAFAQAVDRRARKEVLEKVKRFFTEHDISVPHSWMKEDGPEKHLPDCPRCQFEKLIEEELLEQAEKEGE